VQANPRCSGTKELLTTITGSNIAVVDLDDTLGRLALDMSTHDELQYGLQCYLGMVEFRKKAAQQEKELKAIKDKKTMEKWKKIKDKHKPTSLNYWEVRMILALAM
jgi:hypothetical protein